MKVKNIFAYSIIMPMIALLAVPVILLAEETEDDTEVSTDLIVSDESFDDIADDELTEAEPSDLPDEEEDPALAKRLAGEMLLDVQGNGEVYYIDPVDGGKEYLADGAAAYRLLERRALGINEENFANLEQGTEILEESVCGTNELGTRLRGRIVLRVEEHGEAWWIFPRNCRAYYVGTYDAAYNMMKNFSLGITKVNLARIRNTAREKFKRSMRLSVYAYADENDLTLKEAKDELKEDVNDLRGCLMDLKGEDADFAEKRIGAKECLRQTELPRITAVRRVQIQNTIRETRKERNENKLHINEIRVRQINERIQSRQNNRIVDDADDNESES